MTHLDYFELLEQDQHDPEVQYQLGLRCLHGDGIPKDGQEALHWLQLAAEQGHEQALTLLNKADPGETDEPVTGDNLPDWCARAEDGDAEAQFAVAEYLLQTAPDENQKDIERYLRDAADQGHARACLTMGKKLLDEQDSGAAVFYLERACECNISEAAELLSRCYYYGDGVSADEDRAAQLLERAFDWGDADTKLRIALRYALGDDIFVSQVRALAYVAKAQKAGVADARAVFDARIEAHRQAELEREEDERRLREWEAEIEWLRQEEAEEERLRQEQEAEAERRRQEQKAKEARLAQERSAQLARASEQFRAFVQNIAAEQARVEREKKAHLGKVLDAAEKLRRDAAAKEARLAQEKKAHLEKVCEEGKRVLQLVQLRNRLARFLLVPGSLIAAFAAFAIAFLCRATLVQSALLSCGFAAAAVLASAFVRRGITRQDAAELAKYLEEARKKRNN